MVEIIVCKLYTNWKLQLKEDRSMDRLKDKWRQTKRQISIETVSELSHTFTFGVVDGLIYNVIKASFA